MASTTTGTLPWSAAIRSTRRSKAPTRRPGVAYVLLANLEQSPKEVTCVLHPENLPYPLTRPAAATTVVAGSTPAGDPSQQPASRLDVRQLSGEGLKITLPGDDAILIQVR